MKKRVRFIAIFLVVIMLFSTVTVMAAAPQGGTGLVWFEVFYRPLGERWGRPFQGVEIGMYTREGVLIRTLTTDAEGDARMSLPANVSGENYLIARLRVPAGWIIIEGWSKEIRITGTGRGEFFLERIEDAQPDPEPTIPFTDVAENSWYFNYVSTVNELGLMTGTGDRQFSPNGTVTHAQAITTLWRDAGEPGATAGGTWYSDAVAWARTNGVPLTFNPNEPITRRSIAALFFWYAEYADIELLPIREYTGFSDVQADTNIRSLYRAGILNGMGDGSFAPQGNTIRSQFAALLTRLLTD